MAILISNDDNLDSILSEDQIAEVISYVLDVEGVEREVEVSVSIVSDDEIHELNREWRSIDKATDVLSFECDSAWDETIPAEETLELGDIIVAPAYIAAQAPGFGNTPENELRLMLVHGTLHLLGYDHIEDDEATVMEAREDEILSQLVAEGVMVGPTTHHSEDSSYRI